MKPMFPGVNNSPETILTAEITAESTTISVLSTAGLPAAPNLITIGDDENAEVVCYGNMSGSSLTQCVRGFGGTVAKAWGIEIPVSRCYTAYDHNAFIENIQELQRSVRKYGVRFTGSQSAGERLYDAIGLKAAVSTDTTAAENDFDHVMPWAAMKRCNTALVDGKRVPTFFEGEAGFDNVNKDVFVYVPLFYYYRSDDDREHVVSMSHADGFRAPAKFRNADGTLRDFVFLPAYTAGVDGSGNPISRPGYYPTLPSLTSIMNLCKTKHTAGTLDADIWIEGMKDDEIKNVLLDVEFATRDHQTFMYGAAGMRYATDVVTAGGVNQFTLAASQASQYVVGQAIAVGTSDKGNQITTNATVTSVNATTGVITFTPASGDVTVAVGHYISSRPWKSGICDNVKGPSGSPISNTSGKYPCKYRGIENPWGNQFRWRWDFLKSDAQPYVLDNPENYSATIGNHHTALSYTVPQANGYATEMGYDPAFPYARVTKAIGGGSTTYFADYFYQNSGVRALLVGGRVSHGRYAGARYCYVYNSPGDAYWAVGAALSPA